MVVTETAVLHNLLVRKDYLEAVEENNTITITSESLTYSLTFEEKTNVTISSS